MKMNTYYILWISLLMIVGLNSIPKIDTYIANIRFLRTHVSRISPDTVHYFLPGCGSSKISSIDIDKKRFVALAPNLAGIVNLASDERSFAIVNLASAMNENHALDVSIYLSAVAEFRDGNFSKAMDLWGKNNSISRILITGDECLKSGNPSIAIQYYRVALQSVPIEKDDYYRKLVLFFAKTDDEKSFQTSLKGYLSSVNQKSLSYDQTMGTINLSRGKPADALINYQDAIIKAPLEGMNWYWAGVAAYENSLYTLAERYLKRSLELLPDQIGSYMYLGHIASKHGNTTDAIKWYQKAHTLWPGDSWPLSELAQLEIENGNYKIALGYINKAMETDNRPYLLALAGRAWEGMNNLLQAKRAVEKAIIIDPKTESYQIQLAEICIKLGDKTCAISLYRNILETNPKNQNALKGLTLLDVPDTP